MYTPYLLVLTMFSGAGEIVDPDPHLTLASCEAELSLMERAVETEWSVHGILRTRGECRVHDPSHASLEAGVRTPLVVTLARAGG